MVENMEKERTACFSGYRPHKFDFPLVGEEYENFIAKLYLEIAKVINRGFNRFIVGCTPGMDIISAELVILAKQDYAGRGIQLICALPFGGFRNSRHFDMHWRKRYYEIMKHSDETINVTDSHSWNRGCYDKRNKFMVDNSSLLICYSTGVSGGTENTIKYAKDKGVEIINISTNVSLA